HQPGDVHGLVTAGWDDFWGRFDGIADAVKFRRERAAKQMGTLGAGNHFVEICTDTTGSVWLMLHSGSRNIVGRLLGAVRRGRRSGEVPPGAGDQADGDARTDTPQMAAYRNDLFWALADAALRFPEHRQG
ncbi:RtcB family protein, partial [Streptomyces sp. sk2.1]|uniref:RtcB family protein n=1 Tax=Streptomyces sp. sk2.1 TaxID=2478959 RepID=UPI0021CC92A0